MNQGPAICTIIAKNYVAFARTLAQSFLALHSDGRCFVLIVDDFEGFIDPAEECFEIIRLTDLEIPDLPSLCFKYDVKELCTSVKARLLEYLIQERSLSGLLYLDPDILVTGSLDGIFETLRTYDIVLTPHLDTDYPDDGLLPDDGYILRAGQFNLGFIGLNSSENARSFLQWWKLKLDKKCIVDVLNGYFVDQKFIDFVPRFFENFHVEKDAGYNVAYWNLHSRQIREVNEAWKCNDGPLYFFHFSGYNPDLDAISSHIPNSLSRHQLSNKSDLGKLFAEYKNLLIKNGYHETRNWPYTFESFKTGERIPESLRPYYRSVPELWRSLGDPFTSEKLKRQAASDANGRNLAEPSVAAVTPTEQLNAILNSRAWRWVCRYGRFKNRYLSPAYELFGRLFGGKRREVRQPEKR